MHTSWYDSFMKVSELQFREYYHRYMILEADVLTDKLKDTIPVKEEDCYVLVTAYAKQAEKVSFPVLSLGSSLITAEGDYAGMPCWGNTLLMKSLIWNVE